MKRFVTRSVLTLAGLLVWLGQNGSANELRFSDLEKRLAPSDRENMDSSSAETAAFLSDKTSIESRLPLELGDRTIILHEGNIIFDVADQERKGLTIADLLVRFESRQKEALADDALLLD